MTAVRIVVADDQQVVRAGFAALLDTQPDFTVVGTARDGAEAVRTCRQLRPDVVLMDVRMPGMDGITAWPASRAARRVGRRWARADCWRTAISSRRGESSSFRRGLSIPSLPVCLIDDHPEKEGTMKYMLLIHQGDSPTPRSPEAWATLSEDEQKAVYADYQAINQTPGVTPGLGLDAPETATTVRVQDGKTLTTDGPFVEIKESIGGYLLFEADDLDAAIELASRIPAARLGGAVEVRPIVEW